MGNEITAEIIEKAMKDIDSLPEEKIEAPCGCYITVKGNITKTIKVCEKHHKEFMDIMLFGQNKMNKGEEVTIYGISVLESKLKDLWGD